jgi:hypothetical protein
MSKISDFSVEIDEFKWESSRYEVVASQRLNFCKSWLINSFSWTHLVLWCHPERGIFRFRIMICPSEIEAKQIFIFTLQQAVIQYINKTVSKQLNKLMGVQQCNT